jgi:hypothetical protein
LNSFSVSVRVSDDAVDNPNQGLEEGGIFSLVMSGSGTGAEGLGAFGPLQPADETFTAFIDDPFLLPLIQAEIQDNNRFAIRVDRCCGDFVLKEVSVVLDANVPEPSTAALAIAGCLLMVGWRRMARRRSLVPEVAHSRKHHRKS